MGNFLLIWPSFDYFSEWPPFYIPEPFTSDALCIWVFTQKQRASESLVNNYYHAKFQDSSMYLTILYLVKNLWCPWLVFIWAFSQELLPWEILFF